MKDGDNENLLKSYTYLAEDSLYRADTSDFTKRTITPVMASLAELLRNTPKYEDNYDWFVELARNFHPVSFSNTTTDLGSLIGNTQCGNFRIHLPLRFCVKSTLSLFKPQKLPFWPF